MKYVKTLALPRKLVVTLLIIAENTFDDSCECKIGYDVLCHEARCSIAKLKRDIRDLGPPTERWPTGLGYVAVRRRGKPGYGRRDTNAIELVGYRDSPEREALLLRKAKKQTVQNELFEHQQSEAANGSNQGSKRLIPGGPNSSAVSPTYSRTNNRTNSRTDARSRAPMDEPDVLISAGWRCMSRLDSDFPDWLTYVGQQAPALRDQMMAQRAFCIYVPSLKPWPGCPLPVLHLPTRAETISAGNGAERPRSKD